MYKSADLLSVDIETLDPKLLEEGPGTHRGDGHVCGVGFAANIDGRVISDYLSLTHPDTQVEERVLNKQMITDLCSQKMPKLGTNLCYDAEWLAHEGMPLAGKHNDIQFAEPLLDEYKRSYSLANLAKQYTNRFKQSELLNEYADKMSWKGAPKKHRGIQNIWRMPTSVVTKYVELDIELPLEIFEKQKVELAKQNLMELYEVETDLIPVMLRMRQNGVRLDMPLLKRTIMDATEEQHRLQQSLYTWAGSEINLNSTHQIAKVFDDYKIPYPCNAATPKMIEAGRTEGNPCLNKATLAKLSERHSICGTILDYRKHTTLIDLFLYKYANFQVDGKLYGSFHPLRNDTYGAVSGRFSGSKPNLQQVSAKSFGEDAAEENALSTLHGQIVRKLFIPEEGCGWAKLDYSQVEYRIMAHYATGHGADELRASYQQDKNMDYHQRVMDSTGFKRRQAKNLNFGGMYGIGVATAAELFGWTTDDATQFLAGYHKAAPYIKNTRRRVSDVVADRGYLFTLLGRKARIHPTRSLYSMFNRLIQGSAADVMKKSMVDAEKAGIFDYLKLHMTVHDEMDVSYPLTKAGDEALAELKHIMEETVKLDVPLLVDCHTGANWAEAD